ncbi:MAG: hypothetical protein ABI461_16725 [Polyangiaceae bacterium]
MDEAGREARRKALAEQVARLKKTADPEAAVPTATDSSGELDWEVDDDDPPRISLNSSSLNPSSLSPSDMTDASLDSVDSSWDEEEEEDEEPEPELPDERLDPVAYAAAKQARLEREEARRERKRAKDAAKKALRKARADDAKRKQKGKSKKARIPAPKSVAKVERKRARPVDVETSSEPTARAVEKAASSKAIEKKAAPAKTNPLIFGVVIVVFVAAVIYAILRTR